MSFIRHGEIYQPMRRRQCRRRPRTHRMDEFPADYSLAGWSPPEPASASPAACEYAAYPPRRSIDFQRTTRCVLTICLSRGGKRTARLDRSTRSKNRKTHLVSRVRSSYTKTLDLFED